MQSGRGKIKKWILEFDTKDPSINPLMGWETSTDTLEEVILKFSTKEKAIEYAEKNNISFKVVEPKKEICYKILCDNFLNNIYVVKLKIKSGFIGHMVRLFYLIY